MFGYLIPYKNELKVRELNDWQAAYCGVCHAIARNNGQMPRFALQNDMAGLALMLIDLSGDTFISRKRACPTHLINRKQSLETNTALTYCGDVTTLLAHHKLNDMWQDEKKLYAPIGNLLILRGYRKAKKRNPLLSKKLKDILDELYIIEQDKEVSFDIPAALSGDLLWEIAQSSKDINEKDKLALSDMMKNLGIWIYLADAMEDMESDIKKGCFNPLVQNGTPSEKRISQAQEVMTFALSRAQLAYNLLKLEKSAPIMDNIIRYSLPSKQNLIHEKTREIHKIT
ncbi:MAG: hypothetical protein KAQ68_06195 [Clostridiales bacterium]|nr:hypothetical protein [Clostridiales bacterium]